MFFLFRDKAWIPYELAVHHLFELLEIRIILVEWFSEENDWHLGEAGGLSKKHGVLARDDCTYRNEVISFAFSAGELPQGLFVQTMRDDMTASGRRAVQILRDLALDFHDIDQGIECVID